MAHALVLASFASFVTFDAPATYLVPDNAVVAKDMPINFTISVKQPNLDQLEAAALAVSDPTSPTYGAYLSQNRIDELTAPSAHAITTVTNWLSTHGAHFTVTREIVHVATTVAIAEGLLQTTFRRFSTRSRKQLVRAGSYQIPMDIDNAVAAVFGLHGVPLPSNPPRISAARTSDMPAAVTPSVLLSTYSVNQTVNRQGKNIQAVSEFDNILMSKSDLTTFFKKLVPDAMPGDDQVSRFPAHPYKSGAGVEADLDVQYLMGVAPGVKTEFWEYTSMDFCGDLHTYTSSLLTTPNPPLVNSLSYGWQGNLSTVGCKDADVAAIDVNLAKLAARGISVLVSSGDSGSGVATDTACDPTDPHSMSTDVEVKSGDVMAEAASLAPKYCCGSWHSFHPNAVAWTFTPGKPLGKCTFYSNVSSIGPKSGSTSGGPQVVPPLPLALYSSWPASSPWVTSVGATRFVGEQLGSEEMASDQFGSGGGFSFRFDRKNAKWQEDAVTKYLQMSAGQLPKFPPAGSFDPQGRATPDVSALGEGYQVYVSGGVKSVGGTSASTPAFAGFVSLLNEARFQAGKPPMGFLNPFLYQNPSAFFDVVKGTNAISRTGGLFEYGYAAAPGWDPATGLGTPHFDKLLKAAMTAA